MNISSPDEVLLRAWEAIPRRVKLLFLFVFILGVLTHLFMFMHKLPNHDDINEFTLLAEHNISLGRWFRNVIFPLCGNYSIPFTRGTAALAMLSASVCLVVSALGFTSFTCAALAGALMVTTPILSSMFTFMFMADAFQFALLASCAAVFAARRYRFGFIAAIPLITLSLGTYQAYFCFAASCFLFMLVLDLFDGAPFRSVGLSAAKFASALFGGLAFYGVITKAVSTCTGISLSMYQGISGVTGSLFVRLLSHPLNSLYSLYPAFAKDVFKDALGADIPAVTAARWAMALIFAALCVFLYAKKKILEDPPRCLALTVGILLLPAAISSIYLIQESGGETFMHVVMTYSSVLAGVFTLRLAEKASERGGAARITLWATVLIALLIAWNGYVYSNETYLKMYMGYEKARAFSAGLIPRIEAANGGKRMPLALMGDFERQIDNTRIPSRKFRMMTAAFDGPELVKCNQYHKFLRDYMGWNGVSALMPRTRPLESYPELKTMPVYPAEGSVKAIRGVIVVKLSEIKEGAAEQ